MAQEVAVNHPTDKVEPMPILCKDTFRFEPKAGEPLVFTSAIEVTAQGIFRAILPPELLEIVPVVLRQEPFAACRIETGKANTRLTAPTLDLLRKAIGAAGNEWASCEETVETVILYAHDLQVAYFQTERGAIYPNGYTPEGVEGKWKGGLRAPNSDTHYRIGFAATVREKVVYRRAGSTTVKYRLPPRQDGDHRYPESYHDKLLALTLLRVEPSKMQEMPYSEEAARFFFEIMVGLCAMSDRIETFFADQNQIHRAIRQGRSVLALPWQPWHTARP